MTSECNAHQQSYLDSVLVPAMWTMALQFAMQAAAGDRSFLSSFAHFEVRNWNLESSNFKGPRGKAEGASFFGLPALAQRCASKALASQYATLEIWTDLISKDLTII